MVRVVLAGNNSAAIQVLDLLLELQAEVLCLSPPDSDRASWQEALAPAATARGVTSLQPEDVNDPEIIGEIASFDASLLLSVYYTQIFRPPLIDAVSGPCINLHPSLLPRHRGVAPLIWAIIDGDNTTGVTAHVIDPGIDTGPVLLQRKLPIHLADTGAQLHDKAGRLVAAMCAELLRAHRNGADLSVGRAQTGPATYRDRRVPAVNHLVWTDSRERIRNIVRALAPPLPGAFAHIQDRRVVIAHVEAVEAIGGRPWRPGALSFAADPPIVWAGDGPVRIVEVDLLDGRGTVSGSELRLLPGAYEGSLLS